MNNKHSLSDNLFFAIVALGIIFTLVIFVGCENTKASEYKYDVWDVEAQSFVKCQYRYAGYGGWDFSECENGLVYINPTKYKAYN